MVLVVRAYPVICKNRNFSGVRVPVDLVSVDACRQQCSDEEENEKCFDFLFLHVSPSFQVLLMNYTQGRKTRQIGEWQAWTKSPECQLKPQCIKICDRDNRNNSKYLPDKAPNGTVITGIGARAFKEGLLTDVDLPKSIQDIGEYAFLNNTGAGADHTVTLHSTEPKQMAFNDTATSDYKVAYKGENVMIEGMNGSWTKGSKGGLKFRSSADYHWLFTGRCFVTGITDPGYSHELTEGKDMITSSGSIRVELTDSYLNSLEPGTYQMNIESTVGTATTKFTIGENGSNDTGTPGSSSDDSAGSGSTKVVKTSVKSVVNTGAVRTGDDISVILPAAALAAAVAALVILLAWKNGQRNRKKTEK